MGMVSKAATTVPASPVAGRIVRWRVQQVGAIAALLAGSMFAASPAKAVLFAGTSDPDHNTTAPTGTLAGSGWQYQGLWRSVQGTTVGDSYFLTAKHLDGTPGQEFTIGGKTYKTIGKVDAPGSVDLTLWQVDGTFDSFAPLYTGTREAGKSAVMFGRGFHTRGEPLLEDGDGQLKGWLWEESDTRLRWGRNVVSGLAEVNDGNPVLAAAFDQRGVTDEVHLSSGDSGGGLFIRDGRDWKLAGINHAAQADFRTTADGETVKAAVFDKGGLYRSGEDGFELLPDQFDNIPSLMFSTRVSVNAGWITAAIDSTHRWSAAGASASWGSTSSWEGGGFPRGDWIAMLANTTSASPLQAIVETSSPTRQINLYGQTGEMHLTIRPGVSLVVTDVVNIDRRATIELQPGATLLASEVFLSRACKSACSPRGRLTGSGTIAADVLNSGVVAPAIADVPMRIDAVYRQRRDGTLRLEFAGLDEGQFSRLNVAGRVVLDGTLELVDTGGFETLPGDEFEVLTYTERINRFATIANPNRPGLIYDAEYDDSAGSLLLSTSGTLGDANLDGRVDDIDLIIMADHWKQAVGERGWTSGDFNDDGFINLIDLMITAQNWQAGVAAGAASPEPLNVQAFLAAVPEPGTAALLITALPFLLTRRRRRAKR